MKATGVIRKVDELGRIVIPKELRDVLGIQIKSPLEIFVEADKIILQKYQHNACQITGDVSGQNITLANGNITVGIEGAEYLVKRNRKVLNKSEGLEFILFFKLHIILLKDCKRTINWSSYFDVVERLGLLPTNHRENKEVL